MQLRSKQESLKSTSQEKFPTILVAVSNTTHIALWRYRLVEERKKEKKEISVFCWAP